MSRNTRDATILHFILQNYRNNSSWNYWSAINRGVWWCCGGSDDSDTYCVPANLACNLCHMASRLPPIFPVCLYCQLPKTAETWRENQVQRGFKLGRIYSHITNNFLHLSTLQLLVAVLGWICLWGITLIVRQTSRKRAVEEKEIHKPPPPSPSGPQ